MIINWWVGVHIRSVPAWNLILTILFRSDALDNHMGLSILRLREGLDYSNIIQEDTEDIVADLTRIDSTMSKCRFALTRCLTYYVDMVTAHTSDLRRLSLTTGFGSETPTSPPVDDGHVNEAFTMEPEPDKKKKNKKEKKELAQLGANLR